MTAASRASPKAEVMFRRGVKLPIPLMPDLMVSREPIISQNLKYICEVTVQISTLFVLLGLAACQTTNPDATDSDTYSDAVVESDAADSDSDSDADADFDSDTD